MWGCAPTWDPTSKPPRALNSSSSSKYSYFFSVSIHSLRGFCFFEAIMHNERPTPPPTPMADPTSRKMADPSRKRSFPGCPFLSYMECGTGASLLGPRVNNVKLGARSGVPVKPVSTVPVKTSRRPGPLPPPLDTDSQTLAWSPKSSAE